MTPSRRSFASPRSRASPGGRRRAVGPAPGPPAPAVVPRPAYRWRAHSAASPRERVVARDVGGAAERPLAQPLEHGEGDAVAGVRLGAGEHDGARRAAGQLAHDRRRALGHDHDRATVIAQATGDPDPGRLVTAHVQHEHVPGGPPRPAGGGVCDAHRAPQAREGGLERRAPGPLGPEDENLHRLHVKDPIFSRRCDAPAAAAARRSDAKPLARGAPRVGADGAGQPGLARTVL